MSGWETNDHRHLFRLLAGKHFGDRPEEELDAIRAAKRNRAASLCKRTGCNKESVVLEIGSGMGFTSKYVASEAKQLYCCDISESFLEIARRECANVSNIEFKKIDNERSLFLPFADAFFDIIFADAVFIHLNLYDIFWYFSEFQRLAKTGGRVHIDVKNVSKMDLSMLSEMAGYYRDNKSSLETLLCWNSVGAVVAIAAHFGFKLTLEGRLRRLRSRETIALLFVKR